MGVEKSPTVYCTPIWSTRDRGTCSHELESSFFVLPDVPIFLPGFFSSTAEVSTPKKSGMKSDLKRIERLHELYSSNGSKVLKCFETNGILVYGVLESLGSL